jgi:hypothetical protein
MINLELSLGGHLFGLADFLEPSLQQVLTKLAAEKHLVNLDAYTFCRPHPPAFSAS